MFEDFVSYEQAVKLHECGFDWKCLSYYTNDYTNDNPEDITREVKLHHNWTSPYNHNRVVGRISAPTLWQAQKWLREELGIHIGVTPYSDYSTDADGKVCDRWDFWGFDLYVVVGGERLTNNDDEYDSYEQALSAGIDAALELIEKKGE